jgi:hypothetical protein
MIDEDDCGEIGGMKIGRGNRSTRRKPAPAPLCPPQIPHYQTRARFRAAALGSQRLTAWAMARPNEDLVASPYCLYEVWELQYHSIQICSNRVNHHQFQECMHLLYNWSIFQVLTEHNCRSQCPRGLRYEPAFARSNSGIVGSNPTRDMDVCVRLFCVCVVLCVGSGLVTSWSPV